MPAAPKRPRRPRTRLGVLAHEPKDRPFSQAAAQAWFLDAAARVQPQILRDLTDEPLRVYQAVVWYRLEAVRDLAPWDAVTFADAWATWDDFISELRSYVQLDSAIDLRPLKGSIERWAARWNLGGVAWVKAAALRTLAAWAVRPGAPWEWRHAETALGEVTKLEDRVRIVVVGWDPRFETRDEGKQRMRVDFEQRLATHLEEMDERVATAGLVPTPTKRGADEHWTWLAERVVLRWSYDRIADEAGKQGQKYIATESVHEAVAKAAALAGLPLPKGKPGRPPKTSADRKR